MSKIPSQNKSKPIGANALIKNDENERNMKNTIKESLSHRGNSNLESNNFTGQTASNMANFKNSKIAMKREVIEESENQDYKITTLESSIGTAHLRNTNDQSICSCGKLRGDDACGYNTIQISEYCTCDEGKDNSSAGNNYNKNSKSSRLNNQNIYIQDNIEYCTCDQVKEDEKKGFSSSGPEYGQSMPMVFTDEEIANGVYMKKKVCTCDKNRANKNSQNFVGNQINKNLKNPKNKDENEFEENNQNIYEFKQSKMSQNETINKNYMNSSDKKNLTTSYNELPIQTTDYEDKEKEIKRNVKIKHEINEVNETNEINIKKKINQEINTEEYDENEETQISWSGENYTQVIERMQFLVRGTPQLSVQFLNDMIINATEKKGPIHILLRIPDFHVVKQDDLEIISTEEDKLKMKKKEIDVEQEVLRNKVNLNEELCPENVDLLNISHAYSTAVPSFNDLDIKAEAIFIPGVPKSEGEAIVQESNDIYSIENYTLSCFSNGKPLVIENHGLNIKPSERSWLGKMKLIRNNKINIGHPTKPSWNEIIQKELVSKLNVSAPEREITESKKVEKTEKPKKEKKKKGKKAKGKKDKKLKKEKEKEKIENENDKEKEKEENEQKEKEKKAKKEQREKERQERKEKRLAEKKAKREQREKERQEKKALKAQKEKENQELKEKKKKEKEEKELQKKKKKDPKKFKTVNYSLYLKDSGKQFKKIDIGNNEVITLKAEKRILRPLEKSEESTLELGGKGFKLNKWEPVPMHAKVLNIDRTKPVRTLETITLDRIDFPAMRKKRQNWNLVNNTSIENSINLLCREKKLIEQRVRPITVLAENSDSNKWNEIVRKQRGVKLIFPPNKNWFLDISKEVDLSFEEDSDDVIINDDYNFVQGPMMRPVNATIIKVNEISDSSSVSSYDVFQNLMVRTNFQFNLDNGSNFLKNLARFSPFGDKERDSLQKNGASSDFENEQKNQNDRSVQ